MLVKDLENENEFKEVSIDEVNSSNYIVPTGEEDTYHCKIEIVRYDGSTGRKLSVPRIQKFDKKMYEENVRHALINQGYTIEVLYNPTAYLNAKSGKTTKVDLGEKMAKEAKEKELKDKIKAELMEELRMSGMLKENADVDESANTNDGENATGTTKRGRKKKTTEVTENDLDGE